MEDLEEPIIEGEQIQKEEGLEDTIEERDIEEEPKDLDEIREEEPEGYKEKKKGRNAPLVVGIIIGLIIGFVLFSPDMMGLLYEEPELESEQQHQTDEIEIPIYENYTMFESEDTITYRNENLSVQINVEYSYSYTGQLYDIHYYAYSNEITIAYYEYSPNGLLSAILQNSQDLTDNQMKWFNFTCKNILPIRYYEEYYIDADNIGYDNDELEVNIWYFGTDLGWDASWTYGNKDEILINNTLDSLFSEIEKQKTKMSVIQFKWFKFMCTVELK